MLVVVGMVAAAYVLVGLILAGCCRVAAQGDAALAAGTGRARRRDRTHERPLAA